jgi:hypothetical protein
MVIGIGRRRRRRASEQHTGQRSFEKVMFSFMGPPQLGENKPPAGYVVDDAANLCHRCGQQWSTHERVHTGTMTYRRCPV